ncbi:hypothetical protein BCR41DRAFT_388300 [Lobosporangium transversale]|uniref:RNI-like protein n=1 Tax=Lobosporangium transversale TaxID=64571 RepID=A0A1Y2GFC2_9FUNG|nr:hypothetical protein BCR41DRAFT_388300 [Lobosporangium transversale]ORZ09328.1 hypothetical protein BCR41DRAFT_388300 [Lobosporangium transversale]|eukprot:XP_021878781.1 hypothetical protein BCR41DRAFT_388300 [Lobosporangium transversale]
MMKHQYQQFRNADIVEKVFVRTASTTASNENNSPYYVSLQDVQDVFPDALRFKLEGLPIPFLVDANGNRIEPLRIAFYPDKILDVITKVPQPNSSNSDVAIHLPTSRGSTLSAFQELGLSSRLVQSSNPSLISHNDTQIGTIRPDLDEIKELLLEGRENDNMLLKLQLEAKESHEKMLKLQSEVLTLQHLALDRLAILQKHAKAILVQNFELHEYSIPRLFIIFPVDRLKWDPRNILSNKLRLYFLCECGDTTKSGESDHEQIHIAKHDGYEVRNGTEFFRKYGKYMLILLQWLKLGMKTTPVTELTPVPNVIEAGLNYSIEYMKALSIEYPTLKNINTIDDYEKLEGADLRQLSAFLRINDEEQQHGNLYRTTTEAGHVKWVCLDHYHSAYREKEHKAFVNAVEVNGGKYNPHLGKASVTLNSRIRAEEFFGTLTNAKRVYELHIVFRWEWTKADLEAFKDALKESSVSILRLELGLFQESAARKILSTSTPYEILFRIIEHRRLRVVYIILPSSLIKVPSLPPKRSTHLHKLTIEVNPQRIGPSEIRALVASLKTNTALTSLDLKGNSIGIEGVQTLSDALKTNTTLTAMSLKGNSIGDEGTLALSKALKANKTLAILDLEANSIGEEGALALSEALKVNKALTTMGLSWNKLGDEGTTGLSEAIKTNKALTTLDLNYNSIGKGGARALSEALKVNMGLTTLDLNYNSIGKEGALALSEALKVNTTLITMRLWKNSIRDEGALALAEALKVNTGLTTMSLWNNSIEAEGALGLSEALKTNRTLTTLYLNDNSIGAEGALALSEALKVNTVLDTLGLASNSIGRNGILALSEALKINKALSTLGLSDNSVGDEGALALSEALKTNTTLTTLYLRSSSVGDEGAMALSEALKTNKALNTIDLTDNPIGDEGTLALLEMLKINTALVLSR